MWTMPAVYPVASGGGGPTATWNPADKSADITLSNGDRDATLNAAGWDSVRATVSKSTGKWYWEGEVIQGHATEPTMIFFGMGKATATLTNFCGSDADGWSYLNNPPRSYNNNSFSAYGAAWATTGDIIGVLWDADAGTLEFELNDVSQGVAFASGVTGTMFPMTSLLADGGTSTTPIVRSRLTAAQLAYTLPAGYSAIGG